VPSLRRTTEAFRPYNIEKPLWVFVGHSVTGGRSQQDKDTLTDVQEIVAFFQAFLSEEATWTARIEKVIQEQDGAAGQARRRPFLQSLFLPQGKKACLEGDLHLYPANMCLMLKKEKLCGRWN